MVVQQEPAAQVVQVLQVAALQVAQPGITSVLPLVRTVEPEE